MTASIQQVLKAAETKLAGSLAGTDSPKLDAELLLSHCLGKSREFLVAHSQDSIPVELISNFQEIVERRVDGEPVAYIIGKRAFWDIELAVNPSVLVPRPETELLVETALELLADTTNVRVADLGTGSGAIALALAHAKPQWDVVAVDVSEAALETAQQNARSLGISNVEFKCASWCDGLDSDFYNVIVANPPYISPGDPHIGQGDLRFEPNIALEAKDDGLADLYSIADHARSHLQIGGYLLMEHGFDQHPMLAKRLQELGYAKVEGREDLAGHMRMIQGHWLGAGQG